MAQPLLETWTWTERFELNPSLREYRAIGTLRASFRSRFEACTGRGLSPSFRFLEDRWDPEIAEKLDPAELLRYRSNLLGTDLRITNFAGTQVQRSAKLIRLRVNRFKCFGSREVNDRIRIIAESYMETPTSC